MNNLADEAKRIAQVYGAVLSVAAAHMDYLSTRDFNLSLRGPTPLEAGKFCVSFKVDVHMGQGRGGGLAAMRIPGHMWDFDDNRGLSLAKAFVQVIEPLIGRPPAICPSVITGPPSPGIHVWLGCEFTFGEPLALPGSAPEPLPLYEDDVP